LSFNLWAGGCKNTPINSIFYQPLLKDDGVINLDKSIKILSSLGIKQLILQWSRHGDVDFSQKDDYLESILKIAQDNNIKVVIGLYADDKYFEVIKNKNTDFESYFQRLKSENIQQAKRVYSIAKKYNNFDGWYIYDEIDDKHFRDKKIQNYLNEYLISMAHDLDGISKQNIYISGYFTGQMEPEDFAIMFSYITQGKYIVMLQSGIGAGLVSQVESKIYMSEFYKFYHFKYIPISEVFGMSFEAFVKQNDMLKETSNKRKIAAFSLRYFIEDVFVKNYKEEYCK
jgi:hypothetical protein